MTFLLCSGCCSRQASSSRLFLACASGELLTDCCMSLGLFRALPLLQVLQDNHELCYGLPRQLRTFFTPESPADCKSAADRLSACSGDADASAARYREIYREHLVSSPGKRCASAVYEDCISGIAGDADCKAQVTYRSPAPSDRVMLPQRSDVRSSMRIQQTAA